jgi:thymidylate synthase (FAD)
MVSSGVAKESARKVLPLNTPTRLYMSGTIRSWIHYLSVRCTEDTQLEHREVAEQIKGILLGELPTLKELL